MNFPMKRTMLIALPLILALGAGGVWMAKTLTSTPVTVPEGTDVMVKIDQTLSSDLNNQGDRFRATVAEPIMVDGKTVIPQGARVGGVVVGAHESGHLKGIARLHLALETVEVNGETYNIQTDDFGRYGRNHKKRNWGFIGGGAGGGALIGALAAGGKGALIGGPIGAGAGVAIAALTGKKDITIPVETILVFELSQPVSIDAKS